PVPPPMPAALSSSVSASAASTQRFPAVPGALPPGSGTQQQPPVHRWPTEQELASQAPANGAVSVATLADSAPYNPLRATMAGNGSGSSREAARHRAVQT